MEVLLEDINGTFSSIKFGMFWHMHTPVTLLQHRDISVTPGFPFVVRPPSIHPPPGNH